MAPARRSRTSPSKKGPSSVRHRRTVKPVKKTRVSKKTGRRPARKSEHNETIRKPRSQTRRRVSGPVDVDWGRTFTRFFIVLFLLVDLVLIFFIIRHCSQPDRVIEEQPEEVLEPLQVEVLNGCGVPGLAHQFTDYLRQNAVDVVRTGNYEEEEYGRPNFNVERTVIIDRRGHQKNAVRIAEVLGLDQARVIQQVNEAYLIDATIVLGRDFRILKGWQTTENQDD
jgi:hypothetical protein